MPCITIKRHRNTRCSRARCMPTHSPCMARRWDWVPGTSSLLVNETHTSVPSSSEGICIFLLYKSTVKFICHPSSTRAYGVSKVLSPGRAVVERPRAGSHCCQNRAVSCSRYWDRQLSPEVTIGIRRAQAHVALTHLRT